MSASGNKRKLEHEPDRDSPPKRKKGLGRYFKMIKKTNHNNNNTAKSNNNNTEPSHQSTESTAAKIRANAKSIGAKSNYNQKRKTKNKKETIARSNKNYIFSIFTKVYNTIINPLTNNQRLSFHLKNNSAINTNVDDKKDSNENKMQLLPIAKQNSEIVQKTKRGPLIIKTETNIMNLLSDLMNQYDFDEISDNGEEITVSNAFSMGKKEILKLSEEKYNNCIQQNEDNDMKWECVECVEIATDTLIRMYAPKGKDVLAKGGSARFYNDRVYNHLIGKLHEECNKIKALQENPNNAANEWNNCMIKYYTSEEELLTKIFVMVYIDNKRGTPCANTYPIRRVVESLVEFWLSKKEHTNESFVPKVKDIQYNNPDFYATIRGEIAIDINSKYVTKPIKEAADLNHQIDGWDHAGEKYNMYCQISKKDGNGVLIWLGLEEPTSYGAVGELECVFKVYKRHNIDTKVIRPKSLTYDSPAQHTGKNGGVGALYAKDCKEKGFKWKPIEQLCYGHHGQNYQKDFYRKKKEDNLKYYLEFPECIESCMDTKQRVAVTMQKMSRSNYFSIFTEWCVATKTFDTKKIILLSKVKDIRLVDHLFTSMKQTKRNIIALLAWWYSLITTPKTPIALRNLAYALLSIWSKVKVLRELHLTMDCTDIFNKLMNMPLQKDKSDDGWIGDLRVENSPKLLQTKIRFLANNIGKYESTFNDHYDEINGTWHGLPLLDTSDYSDDEWNLIKNEITKRHVKCSENRFVLRDFIEKTAFIDPQKWKDEDMKENELGDVVFVAEHGKDAIKWYHANHMSDLNISCLQSSFMDVKFYYYHKYWSKNKDITFPSLFRDIIYQQNVRNNMLLRDVSSDFIQLCHRLKNIKKSAMRIEGANASLNLIYGVNRNYGIKGINEAGTICLNGPTADKWNPLPLVKRYVLNGMKPRRKVSASDFMNQPYNSGLFEASKDTKNKQRTKARQKIEYTLDGFGKNIATAIDFEKVKENYKKIEQRKRKRKKKNENNNNNNNNENDNENEEKKDDTTSS